MRLRTLSLYRNRLASLDGCLDVLANSFGLLEELDLGANPCATGPTYRHQLVQSLPTLVSLDGDSLTDLDRELAQNYYEQAESEAAENEVLFAEVGGRAPPPPSPPRYQRRARRQPRMSAAARRKC